MLSPIKKTLGARAFFLQVFLGVALAIILTYGFELSHHQAFQFHRSTLPLCGMFFLIGGVAYQSKYLIIEFVGEVFGSLGFMLLSLSLMLMALTLDNN